MAKGEAARRRYPDVDPQPDLASVEREVLDFWRREKVFEESVEQRPAGPNGSNEYVFYDGPPFANGMPHYGHLVTGYIKDVIPRYQTLRGRRVERRFGWDCHGLPTEMEAEKDLGISGRAQITEYGIDRFNDYCRQSAFRYTEGWREHVTRAARWVDLKNDYKTLDLDYMESILWVFKQLWDKGLIYEGHKVLPYSWACQTVVSNFETRMDNAYRDRQDPAITVRVELKPAPGDERPTDLWIWTTTPWTLPSNLAVAVGPEIEYAVFEKEGRRLILGAGTVAKYESELGDARRVGTIRGRELEGRSYKPLFPFFAQNPRSFRVLGADFVDTEEGTGVVHMAPGFGEDDMEVCEQAGIPLVCPVDDAGEFTAEVPPYAGTNVFDANRAVLRDLRTEGALVKHESYVHGYPHCWRTDEPLIYKAVSSWFVKVTPFRERMVELNQGVNWVPEHFRDGMFGNWLAGARDWSISRNRFWGSPLPVWKSDNPDYPRIDVYGSLDEIERDFGVRPSDLHRPTIDQLVCPNPDDPSGKSSMRRVPEVLDCWFESGAMPYAQVHYPFENRDWFEHHFPADFITEYVAQTRGWFYTMTVLSTLIFDRPAFRNVLCHGVVLDETGRKVSKRLQNYPSPDEMFDRYGADALRWFMVSSPILRGLDLQIDREGDRIREIVRLVILPIWNAYYFFCLYANSEEMRAERRTDSEQVLDRYILSKTRELVETVQDRMDAYDLPGACTAASAYVEALNNWYIRRSRDRFWKHGADADRNAYHTLYTVLEVFLRVISPLLPLISEAIYRGLTGARSVHLGDWPSLDELPEDRELVAEMDRAREVCSAALGLRRTNDARVRQPLRSLTVAGRNLRGLEPFLDLISQEVNVKTVHLAEEIDRYATFELKVNARALGPRLGKKVQEVIRASKQGQWKRLDDGRIEVAGEALEDGDFELGLVPREGVACQALGSNDAVVVLDLELDAALEREGIARDVVRVVQQARRDTGLHVSDRIELALELPEDWREAVAEHRGYVSEQTLAPNFDPAQQIDADALQVHSTSIGGRELRVGIRKRD